MIPVADLQRKHPEWRIVDAIEAPGGGIWVVGADGGVFSLNAQGDSGPGAAPYFGSLPGLGAALGDPAVHGSAVRIERDPQTGGYTVTNTRGERYAFFDEAERQRINQPVQAAPPAAPPPNTDAELNQLMAALRPMGLEGLVNDAWTYYKGPAGGSIAAVLDWLPSTDAYKQRFPGMQHLRDIGQAWTPAQYIQYEQSIREAAIRFGVPDDFVDREDVGKMIAGGVSLNEAVDRMQLASDAVHSSAETLAWARDNFGVDSSGLMAFFLDTDGKGPSFIERQHQLNQAQIGGAAAVSGFGGITAAEAARLESQGLTATQARGAFGQVAGMHPLFEELVGETTDLGRQEQLGLVEGSATAEEAVVKRKAQREAAFSGGGGAATGGRGGTGLGTSGG